MYKEALDGSSAEAAERVRLLLNSVPVPPSRLNVDQTIAGARARERRQQGILTSAAVALVAVSALIGRAYLPQPESVNLNPSPPADPKPTLMGGRTVAWLAKPVKLNTVNVIDMDPLGRYLLAARTVLSGESGSTSATELWVWTGGTAQRLDTDWDGAEAINSSGVMAGTSPSVTPWIAANGQRSSLPTPTGYPYATIKGINARGDVVGLVASSSAQQNSGLPVIWLAASPRQVTFLDITRSGGTPGNAASQVTDLADDGTAVGWTGALPTMWRPNGTRELLDLPAWGTRGEVHSVSGGFCYGTVTSQDGSYTRTTRWELATGHVTVFSEVFGLTQGTADGRILDVDAERVPTLRAERGVGERLPLPNGLDPAVTRFEQPRVSDDGRTIVAVTRLRDGSAGTGLLRWVLR